MRFLRPFFLSRHKTRDEVARRMRERGLEPLWWPEEDRPAGGSQLQCGDVLLWRRAGLISWAGGGRHSHAGMVYLGARFWCLEVREFIGGRWTDLGGQVERYSGRIDVFTPRRMSGPRRQRAAAEMWKFIGVKYGWYSVFRAALRHLPLVRWAVPGAVDDDSLRGWPPFCSEALAEAWRLGAGLDPVRRTPDCYTEPSDFARSPEFLYVGTLISSKGISSEGILEDRGPRAESVRCET